MVLGDKKLHVCDEKRERQRFILDDYAYAYRCDNAVIQCVKDGSRSNSSDNECRVVARKMGIG